MERIENEQQQNGDHEDKKTGDRKDIRLVFAVRARMTHVKPRAAVYALRAVIRYISSAVWTSHYCAPLDRYKDQVCL